ncbi:Prolyl 4-hydroxylase, alpha polypeptide [Halocaridina rubra]|uniref:Prolyl 4-hydroxylase, alpha polypeptide n=1 Tax=Halocaridina rubra TaxID=373956 RepID=A0AAN8WPS0_HALRR
MILNRDSLVAWLWEHNSVHMPILTGRIEALAGLNAKQNEGAESYQVVNYGVGGHYTVHHDAIGNIRSTFNRVATFLIYLTDVAQGGLTVFPWIGVGVQPRRGRAALWYNLDRSGYRDDRVEHASCPVLLGDKWVINKWVYYGGQMNKVVCKANDPRAGIVQPVA